MPFTQADRPAKYRIPAARERGRAGQPADRPSLVAAQLRGGDRRLHGGRLQTCAAVAAGAV
jgi:hypothetical protein